MCFCSGNRSSVIPAGQTEPSADLSFLKSGSFWKCQACCSNTEAFSLLVDRSASVTTVCPFGTRQSSGPHSWCLLPVKIFGIDLQRQSSLIPKHRTPIFVHKNETSCTQIGFKLKSRRLDFLWGQDGIPTLRTPSRYCSGQDLRNTSVQKLLMNQNILTTRAKGQKCRGVGSTSAALSRNFMCWNTNYLSRGATLSPKQCLFVPRGGGEHESRLRSTAIW